MGPIGVLKKIDGAIAAAEIAAAVLGLFAMLVLVAIQVPLRELQSGYDFSWMTPVARYLLLWVTLLGASLATRGRRHIVIDVVTKALPRRAAVGVNVLSALAAMAICLTIAYVSRYFVSSNWTQATPLRGLDKGPAEVIVPLAFAVMAWRFLIVAIEDGRGVVTGDLAHLAKYEHHPAQEAQAGHGERIQSDSEASGFPPQDGRPDTQPPKGVEP